MGPILGTKVRERPLRLRGCDGAHSPTFLLPKDPALNSATRKTYSSLRPAILSAAREPSPGLPGGPPTKCHPLQGGQRKRSLTSLWRRGQKQAHGGQSHRRTRVPSKTDIWQLGPRARREVLNAPEPGSSRTTGVKTGGEPHVQHRARALGTPLINKVGPTLGRQVSVPGLRTWRRLGCLLAHTLCPCDASGVLGEAHPWWTGQASPGILQQRLSPLPAPADKAKRAQRVDPEALTPVHVSSIRVRSLELSLPFLPTCALAPVAAGAGDREAGEVGGEGCPPGLCPQPPTTQDPRPQVIHPRRGVRVGGTGPHTGHALAHAQRLTPPCSPPGGRGARAPATGEGPAGTELTPRLGPSRVTGSERPMPVREQIREIRGPAA